MYDTKWHVSSTHCDMSKMSSYVCHKQDCHSATGYRLHLQQTVVCQPQTKQRDILHISCLLYVNTGIYSTSRTRNYVSAMSIRCITDVLLHSPDVTIHRPQFALSWLDTVLNQPDVVLYRTNVVWYRPDVVLCRPDVALTVPEVSTCHNSLVRIDPIPSLYLDIVREMK